MKDKIKAALIIGVIGLINVIGAAVISVLGQPDGERAGGSVAAASSNATPSTPAGPTPEPSLTGAPPQAEVQPAPQVVSLPASVWLTEMEPIAHVGLWRQTTTVVRGETVLHALRVETE